MLFIDNQLTKQQRGWSVKRILIFLSLFMAAGAQEALSQNYNFQVIDFPGAVSTGADGVNNLGQVVGG